jgi:hypothetical protein
MSKIAVTKFCSTDAARPELKSPWVWNEKTVASDGRIIIAVDGAWAEQCDMQEQAPHDADKVMSELHSRVERWIPLSDHYERVECNLDTCENCDGDGEVRTLTETITAFGIFNAYYLNLILDELADVEMGIVQPYDPLLGIPFRFNHGIGVLMPIRPKTTLDSSAAQSLRDEMLEELGYV